MNSINLKTKLLIAVVLSLMFVGCGKDDEPEIFVYEDHISGRIVSIPNPCLEEPCLPGMVLAISSDYDSINYILALQENSLWKWCWFDELIINNDTLRVNDSVYVRGIRSAEKNDIHLQKYYVFSLVNFIKL